MDRDKEQKKSDTKEEQQMINGVPAPVEEKNVGRYIWIAILTIVLLVFAVLVLWGVRGTKNDKGSSEGTQEHLVPSTETATQENAGGTSDVGKESSDGSDSENNPGTQTGSENSGNSGNMEATEPETGTEGFGSRPVNPGSSILNTGNLSENASTYEGTPGTGEFNYGEALQKSLLFYELQRSGALPEIVRCNWRGDSALNDGADVGLDLTGGWYDAGDHVKFNLPMAYTAAMLAWSVYEDYDAYVESGQLEYALGNIRWVNDYLIKCHPEPDVYYYQVGDGNQDHTWWGPAEGLDAQMKRPSYKVDRQNPGSCVVGEAAAALAACSVVFADSDPEYAALCLSHARELYRFADETRSDAGYTAANNFYNSWSGYWDELAWSAAWLYIATGEKEYLDAAKAAAAQASGDYDWAHCWDNVYFGANLLLAQLTGDRTYSDELEHHLDTWTVGYNGKKVNYTPDGLACIDQWGPLRYATTTAFLAAVYSEWEGCPKEKQEIYWNFAVAQVNYALGSTGQSYVVGFGENSPQHPHHRTAQGSSTNNMNEPSQHRHTLYGALVGGPNASGYYDDSVSNYTANEVACDYNAGFTGALAKLYSVYKGETLVDFGAVEDLDTDELYINASVNVNGTDFIEIRAFVYNETAWPARVTDDLELRYYIDLSECFAAGGSAGNIEVTGNYMQGGTIGGLYVWDEENHIYYVSIDFSNTLIYPGGQDAYKKEVQFRIRNANGAWDNENDPSFADLLGNNGSQQVKAYHMALYEGGKLVFGSEPAAGDQAGALVTRDPSNQNSSNGNNNQGNNGNQNNNGNQGNTNVPDSMIAETKELRVENQTAQTSGSGNTIAASLKITNQSDGYLKLSDLNISYYFTADGASVGNLAFWCDYSAINSSDGYTATTGDITGSFSAVNSSIADCDTVCEISGGSGIGIAPGGELYIQIRITKSDWTDFQLGNDYSSKAAENIVIKYQNEVIFGQQP